VAIRTELVRNGLIKQNNKINRIRKNMDKCPQPATAKGKGQAGEYIFFIS
jgi:hypothetical protein